MRIIVSLSFTLRLLAASFLVYNFTRLLPGQIASRIRTGATLRLARRIAHFFVRQGGVYIKAAQYLSSVSNLFETEFTEIFGSVSDSVPHRPYSGVRFRFLAEFGVEPEELYGEFDREALAAASLGQVHRARLKDGRAVAVKLLHPGIEEQAVQDLRAMRYALNLTMWFFPHLDFRGHLKEFAAMISAEIDYENEAENMRRVRRNFQDLPDVIIPEVIDELSGSTVLTTEFIEGIRIDNVEGIIRSDVDRTRVTELLVECYARMIFDHRFYHADPHPGNIFVVPARRDPYRAKGKKSKAKPEGVRIALVDFGATQFVSDRTFRFLQRGVANFRARDIPAVVEQALQYGLLRPEAAGRQEAYVQLFELIYARYSSFKLDDYYRLNPLRFGRMVKLRDLETAGLRLRDIMADVRLPRILIYLGRTFTLILSLAMRMDDRVNIFLVAKPFVDGYLPTNPTGFMTLLRQQNWNALIERALSAGRGQDGPFVAPPVDRSAGLLTALSLLTLGFSFLAAYLYMGGAADLARYPLVFSGISALGVCWRMFRS